MTDPGQPRPLASPHPRGSLLAVTVSPRGARNQIEQAPDGTLRIRVTAPPVDGAANAAVLRFLADSLGVPPSSLEIVSGEGGRRKRILVNALTVDELVRRLRQIRGSSS